MFEVRGIARRSRAVEESGEMLEEVMRPEPYDKSEAVGRMIEQVTVLEIPPEIHD